MSRPSLAQIVWLRRAEEQVYSGQTDRELQEWQPGSRPLTSRICAKPDCERRLGIGNHSGLCRRHFKPLPKKPKVVSLENHMGIFSPKAQNGTAPKPQKQFTAYTMVRRKDGWAIVTVLANETDIVDESDIDTRSIQIGKLVSKYVRLE